MVLVGSGSVSFDTDPGKLYGFHGSGSATLALATKIPVPRISQMRCETLVYETNRVAN